MELAEAGAAGQLAAGTAPSPAVATAFCSSVEALVGATAEGPRVVAVSMEDMTMSQTWAARVRLLVAAAALPLPSDVVVSDVAAASATNGASLGAVEAGVADPWSGMAPVVVALVAVALVVVVAVAVAAVGTAAVVVAVAAAVAMAAAAKVAVAVAVEAAVRLLSVPVVALLVTLAPLLMVMVVEAVVVKEATGRAAVVVPRVAAASVAVMAAAVASVAVEGATIARAFVAAVVRATGVRVVAVVESVVGKAWTQGCQGRAPRYG